MSPYRKLIVDRIVQESSSAKSFYLVPADGQPVQPYLPGQHLPLRLAIPDEAKPVYRFYTLSDCHGDTNQYRLTIKREPNGSASKYFHDVLKVGDVIEAKAPGGQFVLDTAAVHPVVMIAGGIGMTPMIAMLNAVMRDQPDRVVWFFLALRNRNDYAFADHLREVTTRLPNVRLNVSYSEPVSSDGLGVEYHRAGFVDVPLLKSVLPTLDMEYYVCGPKPMMDAVIAGLTGAGVTRERIHTESFGRREVDPDADVPPAPAATGAAAASSVTFQKSGKTVPWDAECDSLWHFAEANGIDISSGCLYGDCGTCLTKLVAGDVVYKHKTAIKPDPGTCLPCSCKPRGVVVLDV